jgi:pimeloyl-ACP methyl ester carboxylesterase
MKIRGVIEWYGDKYGPLIIVCNGFKAVTTQPQIKMSAKALAKAGFTVVRFDPTNSTGKSDGPLVMFTLGGYIHDVKQVIKYSLKVTKHNEYILFGFSIGAMVSYIIASQDRRVKKSILQAPVYDIKVSAEHNKHYDEIKKRGWKIIYARSIKRNVKRGYLFYQEGFKYKSSDYLKKIKCPTLVLYGSKEEAWNKKMINILFKKLKMQDKSLKKILSACHTLRTKKVISAFIKEILNWLGKGYENQA